MSTFDYAIGDFNAIAMSYKRTWHFQNSEGQTPIDVAEENEKWFCAEKMMMFYSEWLGGVATSDCCRGVTGTANTNSWNKISNQLQYPSTL